MYLLRMYIIDNIYDMIRWYRQLCFLPSIKFDYGTLLHIDVNQPVTLQGLINYNQ